MKVDLILMKNALTPLAKSVLLPLGLRIAVSTTYAAIQTKIYGSGEEIDDIMKIVKYLEESGSLINVVSKKMENETLGASLLGNIWVI